MIRWLLYRFVPYYIAFTAILALVLLLISETGLQWLWKQAQPHMPENLSVERVSGRLIGRIQVDGLSYSSESLDIQAQQAWVDWSPSALLRGLVQLNEVTLIGVQVDTRASTSDEPPSPRPEQLPGLPNVALKALRLRDIRYAQNGQQVFHVKQGRAEAQLKQQAISLSVLELDMNELGRWQAQLAANIEPTFIRVDELTVQGQQAPRLYLAANGTCPWPSLACDANLSWAHLRWPLDTTVWASPSGEGKLALVGKQAHMLIDAELNGEQIPESRLFVTLRSPDTQGEWSLQGQWEQISTSSNAAEVNLDLSYAVATQQFRGALDLSRLNLAAWAHTWPSSVNGRIELNGDLKNGISLTLPKVALNGSVRQQPLNLDGAGRYNGTQDWSAERLRLRWGEAELAGRIQRAPNWKGQLKLAAPDLGQLDKQFNGQLSADLKISGKRALPDLNWTLAGQKLRFATFNLATLQSQGQISAALVQLSLAAKGLSGPGLDIETLTLESQGDLNHARSQIVLEEFRAHSELSVNSHWNADQQALRLELVEGQAQFGVAPRPPGMTWTAEQGATLNWSKASGLSLSSHCWRSRTASACLEARWDTRLASGLLALDGYNLKRLRRVLPSGSRISGDVSLKAELKPSALNRPDAQLALTTGDIEVTNSQNPDNLPVLTLLPGSLSGEAADGAVRAHWSFPVSLEQGRPGGVSGAFSMSEQRELNGQLKVDFDDLTVLSTFISEVMDAQGQLVGALNVRGTLKAPQLGGELQLKNGNILLDTPNIQLKQTQISLLGDGGKQLKLKAQTQSGDGQLQLDGEIDWSGLRTQVNARIRGEDFLAVNIPEAQVKVSPDLTLAVSPPRLDIRGRIRVPSAELRPRDLTRRGAIAPDADQIIVGEEASARAGLQVHSEIELVLGNAVNFEGLGLTTRLEGRLKTRMRPGRAATGEGDLRLKDGRYKAYGQNLTIETGRLIFSGGPLTEPGLDIKAYRQANSEVRAGVIVRGLLAKPEVSLYSSPSMRETDQLSYLVLGRAAESSSEDDQNMLNNAALALGLKGSDFLAKRFKGKLGLDEVSIGAQPGEESSQASLVLGKYLSPDIYVSYGIGLFEPVYTFNLRYQLSSKWSLQTESGVESGGDLFYTIER